MVLEGSGDLPALHLLGTAWEMGLPRALGASTYSQQLLGILVLVASSCIGGLEATEGLKLLSDTRNLFLGAERIHCWRSCNMTAIEMV